MDILYNNGNGNGNENVMGYAIMAVLTSEQKFKQQRQWPSYNNGYITSLVIAMTIVITIKMAMTLHWLWQLQWLCHKGNDKDNDNENLDHNDNDNVTTMDILQQ